MLNLLSKCESESRVRGQLVGNSHFLYVLIVGQWEAVLHLAVHVPLASRRQNCKPVCMKEHYRESEKIT